MSDEVKHDTPDAANDGLTELIDELRGMLDAAHPNERYDAIQECVDMAEYIQKRNALTEVRRLGEAK